MAKPLGPKTLLIREAIAAHPDTGNTGLAELINGSDARKQDKIKVSANDVAQQRQAMKKAGLAPAAKSARRKTAKKQARQPAAARASTAPQGYEPIPPATQLGPVDLIDRVFALAEQCGGMAQLKRLVDRLA